MATFVAGGNEVDLNGVTAVEVVGSPAASTQRIVRNVHFSNVDSASVTIILLKKKGATSRELAREVLAVGDYWTFDKVTVLDATDESLVAKLSAAAATTNPTVDAAYSDQT